MVTEATAKPESMDPIAESDVRISVNRIVKLLQSGIFDPANHAEYFLNLPSSNS